MGKTSNKQFLRVITTLVDNLPDEEIERFDSGIAQTIIDGRQTSGREFMRFLQNGARVHVVGNHVIDCSADPFVPSDWRVEEHQRTGDFVWDPNKILLYLSDNQMGSRIIDGNKLCKELKNKPVLNANILDYLLAHPELIPEDWKNKNIFFWGTIYRDSGGGLGVRCLDWGGGCWDWGCRWLGYGWYGGGLPAAVSAGA